jgi:hypothetical protein
MRTRKGVKQMNPYFITFDGEEDDDDAEPDTKD